jgi:hypothetical protein
MGYKVKLKEIVSKNEGDCWCNGISLFTGKSYDTIYEMFKPFEHEGGGVALDTIKGYFESRESYVSYKTELSLKDALIIYDNSRGILFLVKDKHNDDFHVVYVKNDTIHDVITKDMLWWYIVKYDVVGFILESIDYD